MSLLSITRSLTIYTNPTETQLDTMRTDLLNYFNSANMTETNIATAGITFSKLGSAPDDNAMDWASSSGEAIYVSGSTTFRVKSSSGAMVFNSNGSESLRTATTGTTTIGTGGALQICQGVGLQSVNTMWLLSSYRKPPLFFYDTNSVYTLDNGPNAGETLIVLRDRLVKLYSQVLSLNSTANGYDSGHTSTAANGLRSGLARTANTWYYVYAALVRGGSQNDGTYGVLVADTTSPLQANAATLDGYYGAGKWVYMGLVRNGYNDGTNTNIIVHFINDGYGMTRFTSSYESGLTNGIRLATASASSADLVYSLSFGGGAADIPPVCTRAVFSGYRSGYGFSMDYKSSGTGETNMRVSSGEADSSNSSTAAVVLMDVPLITSYQVVIVVGVNSTNQRVSLSAVVDHYV